MYVRQCFNLFIIRPPAGAESLSGHSESERRPLMAAANWPVSSTLHHYDTLTCTQWSPFKIADVGIRPSVSSLASDPGLQIEKNLPVRYSNKQVLIENDRPIRSDVSFNNQLTSNEIFTLNHKNAISCRFIFQFPSYKIFVGRVRVSRYGENGENRQMVT